MLKSIDDSLIYISTEAGTFVSTYIFFAGCDVCLCRIVSKKKSAASGIEINSLPLCDKFAILPTERGNVK